MKTHWIWSTNIKSSTKRWNLFRKARNTEKTTSCIISRLCKIFHNTHDHDRNIKLGSCWDWTPFALLTPTKNFVWNTFWMCEHKRKRQRLGIIGCDFTFLHNFSFRNTFIRKILFRPTAKLGQIHLFRLLHKARCKESFSDQFAGTSASKIKKLTWKLSQLFSQIFFS